MAINLLSTASDNKYHFALDGHTWHIIQTYYADFIPNIVARGTIFARFRPEQKSQIVLCLQQFDYIVAMCGDGANDCGALKAAHIGISLSQAEASVAAPFTSKDQNISCVKYLALEGRCALVTSFGLFKYMTLYSLIQFCTILILYSVSEARTNVQNNQHSNNLTFPQFVCFYSAAMFDTWQLPVSLYRSDHNGWTGVHDGPSGPGQQIGFETTISIADIAGQCDTVVIASQHLWPNSDSRIVVFVQSGLVHVDHYLRWQCTVQFQQCFIPWDARRGNQPHRFGRAYAVLGEYRTVSDQLLPIFGVGCYLFQGSAISQAALHKLYAHIRISLANLLIDCGFCDLFSIVF